MKSHRQNLRPAVLVSALTLLSAIVPAMAADKPRPNILLIVADDMGYWTSAVLAARSRRQIWTGWPRKASGSPAFA